MKQLVLILLTLSIVCCTKESSQKTTLADSVAGAGIVAPSSDPIPGKKPANVLFNKDSTFEILSHNRGIIKSSSAEDTLMCKGWTIAKETIAKIIRDSEPLSGPDLHHMFDVLPCIIKGEIIQNGLTYEFKMNAGSWTYISSQDTTFMLGSFKKENEKYFVSSALTHE